MDSVDYRFFAASPDASAVKKKRKAKELGNFEVKS